jgi:hypothetical protein
VHEIDGLDNIGVVERGADAELASELFQVFALRLLLAPLPKFLPISKTGRYFDGEKRAVFVVFETEFVSKAHHCCGTNAHIGVVLGAHQPVLFSQ